MVRLFGLLSCFSLMTFGCGDTYCQSGPKYGTKCYSATDLRSPPGGRPPLASEPPPWFTQSPPPARFGASPAPARGPVPMNSINWKPTNTMLDGGGTETVPPGLDAGE